MVIQDTVRPAVESTPSVAPVPHKRTVFDWAVDKSFQGIRDEFFRNVQFTEPKGDPGWFGPGSAVWYIHEHLPTVQIAMGAAAMMETLHPDMAWMAYEHTRAIERINGVPTGQFDEKAMSSRSGHTLSFFFGVAMASTPVAERVSKTVRGMHNRIEGVRPDGHPYKASDPDLLTWNYCTQAWAIAASHRAFHPDPLSDDRLEEFFHDYARMGRELGGANVPTTKEGVDKYLADSLPYLAVTMPTVELLNPTAPWRYPAWQRPLMTLVDWAIQDLHPDWAQKLMNTRQYPKPVAAARRRAVKALLGSFRDGKMKEVYESYERVGAPFPGA